jgi:hypothetical protein
MVYKHTEMIIVERVFTEFSFQRYSLFGGGGGVHLNGLLLNVSILQNLAVFKYSTIQLTIIPAIQLVQLQIS